MKLEYSNKFARFWSAFPRHTGKGQAWKAFQKLAPTDDDVQTMIDALAWQVDQPQWRKENGEYVPHASTWLNQRRWEDEPFHMEHSKPRYVGWTCPHTPPCDQRHHCALKTAKAALYHEGES
jgi:hypothetical protein